MAQPHSMDNLLNHLLGDGALGQDLSPEEKIAVRAMVGEIMGDLPEELFNSTQSAHKGDSEASAPDVSPAIAHHLLKRTTQRDALLSKLGMDSSAISEDVTVADLLNQQSDDTLIEILNDHIDFASSIVDVLSTRRRKGQALDIMRRVELQMMALSIGVADLQEALERPQDTQTPQRTWRHRIKTLLMREFHFINNLIRYS